MATPGNPPSSESFPSAVPNEAVGLPKMAAQQRPSEAIGAEKPSDGEDAAYHQAKKWDYEEKGGADFNMEAPILAEDVIRAGGLGARDDLDSFLPSAVDATDYEESLNDAMQYEEVPPVAEGEIPRPGVGFVKAQHQDMDGFRDK